MTELVGVFAGGLLGSAHCVGMCGGFAAIVGASRQPLPGAIARQLVYGAGRVFTYAFLGALAGYSGSYVARFDSALFGAQRLLSITAGVCMVSVGVTALGLVRLKWLRLTRLTTHAAPVFRHFLDQPGVGGVFLAGVANGFLPCGLVYAFIAMAVASGGVVYGMLLMLCFGLGTIPAMTLIGCGSTFLSHRARLRFYRLAACFVILAGATSIYRAWSRESTCCGGGAKFVATKPHRH